MLDLESRHLAVVVGILNHHVPGARTYAFGSRVTGRAHRFSDLDLAIQWENGLDLGTMAKLREEFSESNLPMKVDVVDLLCVSSEFKKIILQEVIDVV